MIRPIFLAIFLLGAVVFILSSIVVARDGAFRVRRFELPGGPPIELKLIAKLGPGPSRENSGIVKSRRYPDLYWMHNDSGDEPRIYPIHRNGKNYADTRYEDENGVLVGGAINVDWEDITVNGAGEVIIADLGNNENDRRDLVFYILDEPAPTAGRTTFRRKIFVRYPDQQDFPADREHFNFDCEAIFTVDDTIYLLSKNRSDTLTTMYRLDDAKPEVTNVLTKLGSFDIRGQAVGADCSVDGLRLVVLTYNGIWMFDRASHELEFFDAGVSWAPLAPRDSEAICFADNDTLLIADEASGELFETSVEQLSRVR